MIGRRARRRDESGESIIETVISLAVIAIILPSFFGLMFTEVTSARIQRQSALDNQAVLSIAETIKADAYVTACPVYSISTATLPTNWSGSETQSCQTVPTQPSSAYSVEMVTVTAFTASNQTGPGTSVVVVKSGRS